MARREFHFTQDGAGKFWAFEVKGNTLTVQFGRLNTTGQLQTKLFDSPADADRAAAKLVAEKLKKGYREIGASKPAPKAAKAAKTPAAKAPPEDAPAGPLVRNCKPDPKRRAVLAECLEGCDFLNVGGEWPGHFFSTRTVAYSCGALAREGEPVVHAHDPDELDRCKKLAAEAAAIMKNVDIGMGDESDHKLSPFFLPANVGDKPPTKITEAVFRKAMGGVVLPGAVFDIEPFKKTSNWWKIQSALHPDYHVVPEDFPDEVERVAQWGRLFEWFSTHPDLHAPVYLGFKKQPPDFTSVFPKFFLALTAQGSLVGLITFVVWS